ncbi:MAG TPA: hypothetical protein PLZ51_23515, partial [Aggregatilineales bacterium]|nr:hypothetical protein [Aggregatilineales bacterium]
DGDAQTAQFDEPADVKYHDGKLYVADTNNHAIRVIDLTTNMVSTIVFPNPEKLRIAQQVTVIGGNASSAEAVILPSQAVKTGEIDLIVRFTLPEGYKINAQAPSLVRLADFGDTSLTELETRIPITVAPDQAPIIGTIDLFYCEAVDESLCF